MLLALVAAPFSARPAGAEAPPQEASRDATAMEIAAAKTEVANLYAEVQAGTAPASELRQAERELTVMTGERIPSPIFGGRKRLERDFAPFRQMTDYYCGPATVQSILWFLGARDESATADPARAKGMTGRADLDQQRLAEDRWLGTEAMAGTDWGAILPDVINEWRGSRWYGLWHRERRGHAG